MYGNPHRGTIRWPLDLEVGIVLVPVGPFPNPGGFQEDLVQMKDNLIANQAGDRFQDLWGKWQAPYQAAVETCRAKLQVLCRCRGALAISVGRHVPQDLSCLQIRMAQ